MIIRNGQIPKAGAFQTVDLLIEAGKITKIAPSLECSHEEEWDAKGLVLLPGVVDLNVRFSNSSLTQEHIDKLAKSALKGGVTTAVVMSDFTPRLESATLLELVKFKIDQALMRLHLSAPLAQEGVDQLCDVATLLNKGASAILANSNRNANVLRRGMQYALMKQKPLFVQCYDPNLDDNGVMNEGVIASKLGLSGISKLSETTEVAKVAEMACYYGSEVVFKTLSTTRSLETLSWIKERHPHVYAEVSIHHLAKNDTACDGFNTYAKLMPPLREEEERLALIRALQEGKIDLLTSAHAPKSILYKDVAFEDAAFGMGSIEEFLSLAYTTLVRSHILSFERLMELCASVPAKILGEDEKGRLEEGYVADIVCFDPHVQRTVSNKNSLYDGDTLYGEVKKVFVSGRCVVDA